jgi:uncharacterized protein YndB with AHSA1/START domain
MKKQIIEKAIDINAAPEKVWRVFTDPAVTRQMGGEYETAWTVGSSFGWKGKDGNLLTHGTILDISPAKLLKHNLFDSEARNKITSVITYRFVDKNEATTLLAKEELNYDLTEAQYQEASEGWNSALAAVKEIAEKI